MEYLSEKRFVPVMKAAPETIDRDKRTLQAVITSNQVDRDGEIVEPGAFKGRIDSFLANPVLLWGHDPHQPPIGKALGVEFFDDRVEAEFKFRKRFDGETLPDIFELYADLTLSSFSIGFRVFKLEIDAAENGERKPPRIVDAELFEVSAVSLPSNTAARAKHLAIVELLDRGAEMFEQRKALPAPIERLAVPITPLLILDRASGCAADVLDRVARGERVPAQELAALDRLRSAVLRPSKNTAGVSGGDVGAAALDSKIASELRDLVTTLRAPTRAVGS